MKDNVPIKIIVHKSHNIVSGKKLETLAILDAAEHPSPNSLLCIEKFLCGVVGVGRLHMGPTTFVSIVGGAHNGDIESSFGKYA